MSDQEKEKISKYIDSYIDSLRIDVVMFDRVRHIKKQSDSRVVIIDEDFFIDNNKGHEVFFRNPVEECLFLPKKIDYFETRIDLDFDSKVSFRIIDFVEERIVRADSVPLDDSRVTDECLRSLVGRMCLDVAYQKLYPEVKTAIDEFFSMHRSPDFEILKNRIGPFMGIK